jgi:hypothetical protein
MGQTGAAAGAVPVLKASGSRKMKRSDRASEVAVSAELSFPEKERTLHIDTQDCTRGHFRSLR